MPVVLWWGRGDRQYSRERVLRRCLVRLGWTVREFYPRASVLGDLEAALTGVPACDLLWVPCFRQRDLAAAYRWSRRRCVPLVFDPLISAYDKQIYERGKYAPGTRRAGQLLSWERKRFGMADLVLADTVAHARYFQELLGVRPERLRVVPVGAEEPLFHPQPVPPPGTALEVLFFGSFIALQGPEIIVQAAHRYHGPSLHWTLLGEGPLKRQCEARAAGADSVSFEDWIPYESLPARIHRAHVILGIFGTTPKTQRVIPNKVFQGLACGRPVITSRSPAYPTELLDSPTGGVTWTAPGDAQELAERLAFLASDYRRLALRAQDARSLYDRFFAEDVICSALREALACLGPWA